MQDVLREGEKEVRIMPSYYLMPLVMGVGFTFLTICKMFFTSTSRLSILGNNAYAIIIIVFQLCELGYLGCIHFWIAKLMTNKLRWPVFPLNMAFLMLYILIFLTCIYEFENVRHNMQTVLFSTIKAYILKAGSEVYKDPLYAVQGDPSSEGPLVEVARTVVDAPGFFAVLIIFVASLLSFAIYLVVKYWKLILYSMIFDTKSRDGMAPVIEEPNNDEPNKRLLANYKVPVDMQWKPKNEYRNVFFIVFHIGAILHIVSICVFLFYPFEDQVFLQLIRPVSYNMIVCLSHNENKLSERQESTFVPTVRSYLPPGRFWLDEREKKEFTAVHGDKSAFCAYNNNHEMCKGWRPTPTATPLPVMPNIAFLTYESMNPLTYLIDDEFIDEHVSVIEDDNNAKKLVTDTPYYSRNVLPHLREFAKNSITFSGMSSLGLPTFSGWNSLVTGALPSQSFMNMVDGHPVHIDDLPSFMRGEGYRTYFVSTSEFGFDGTRNWAYRRSAEEEALIRENCIDGFGEMLNDEMQRNLSYPPDMSSCTSLEKQERIKKRTEELQSISKPKWFDYLVSYFPTENQAEALNLSYDTLTYHDWASDRITSHQFRYHWKQQREYLKRTGQSKKPIFGSVLGIESHLPYFGYDQDEFYPSANMTGKETTEEARKKRFIRVNKYVDEQFVHNTIEWLRENEPNTIVVVTGDHGTRDIPVHQKNESVTSKAQYSSDCVGGSSGLDSYFVVSGVIGYLGDDPVVKEALGLNRLAGKTLKIAADHNDLAYTLEEIVSKFNGHSVPPTNKRSRNLITLADEIVNISTVHGAKSAIDKLNRDGWRSASAVSFQYEYRKGAGLFRTHTGDLHGSHMYGSVSYPTCLKANNKPDMKLGGENAELMYDEMIDFVTDERYLYRTNKLFHYDFRNSTCIQNGHCEFPHPMSYEIDDSMFYIAVIGIPFLVAIMSFGIVMCLHFSHCFYKENSFEPLRSGSDL